MFLVFNIFLYILCLIFLYQIIGPKYRYPFRIVEVITLFILSILSFIIQGDLYQILVCLFSNLLLFYIFFHVFNMIQTSPRVYIISLIGKKNEGISINNLLNYYNEKNIIDNRLIRMKSSEQIIFDNLKKIKLSKKSFTTSFIYNILLFVKKYL